MKIHKHTNIFIILVIFLLIVTIFAYSATPEKPYPALEDGDRLQAAWLMGMFNVIYDWAQTTNNAYTLHVASSTVHGITGEVVGTSDVQTLTNKSISGEQIDSGTVADARIASTLARDSEVTTAVTNHNSATVAHGATGAVMGTTNSQSVTNKAMGSGCTWGGTAVPVANGGTGATSAASALVNFGLSATAAEINYTDGVTSAIQTQLNGKQATIAGGATTITSSNLTASRALVSDGSGKVTVSAVTSTELAVLDGITATVTELNYCDGVTSAIQTQINSKAASSHTHNYAGSSSAGGNANVANAIRTSAPASPVNGDIWTE